RVACQYARTQVFVLTGERLFVFVPQGPAWGVAAAILRRALNILPAEAFPLVLGFMQDWSKQCSDYRPYPAGSREIAQIALFYLEHFDGLGWRAREAEEWLVKLLLKVPRAAETELKQMITAALTNEEPNYRDDKLLDLLLNNFWNG